MQFILLFFISLIVFYINFYNFGFFLINKLKLKLSSSETILLSFFTGLSVVASSVFFLGLLMGTKAYLINYFFFVIGLTQIKKSLKHIFSLKKTILKNKFSFLIIFVFSLTLYISLALSWFYKDGALLIQKGQIHDASWHIALVKQLKNNIPPIHPSSFNEKVEHYHYFYDLLIATISQNFKIDLTFIYFQFFPLIIVLFLSLSLVVLMTKFKLKKYSILLAFLIYFGGNFGYLIPFFLKGNTWSESSFWVSQTFNMMGNPQLILSFVFLFIILIILFKIEHKKIKFNYFTASLISFLIASSMGIKTYSYIVLSLIYLIFLIRRARKKTLKKTFLKGMLHLAISTPYFLSIVGFNKPSFFFHPLWYSTSMFAAPDRLNYVRAILLEQHYIANHDYLKLILLKVLEVGIFIIGNLGTRVILFLIPFVLLFKKKMQIHLCLDYMQRQV